MSFRYSLCIPVTLWLATFALPALGMPSSIERSFETPVDAMSVRLPDDATSFQYATFAHGTWSDWGEYESDGDVLPGEESELIMLPQGTTRVRLTGIDDPLDVHPIHVSHEPIRRTIAANSMSATLRIIARAEWGADRALLYRNGSTSESSSGDTGKGDNGALTTSQSDKRASECQAMLAAFPLEFQMSSPIRVDASGKEYRWPLQYMPSVKLLVIHHTAIQVTGDPRPAVERVRALYQYHAENRGWGDIGYHYLIDEEGHIYEGRQGGPRVVGGHAYCNNVGTLGIALLGNFDVEQPSAAQTHALQYLLSRLAKEEGIDVERAVTFRGKQYKSPIVGHRDLLSTSCPGATLAAGLSQIRTNVAAGQLDGDVVYPTIARPKDTTPSSAPGTMQQGNAPRIEDGIGFLGRTAISAIPGGMQRLSFSYTAGIGGAYSSKKVADVWLSSPAITLWVDDGIRRVPVTKGILLPYDLPAGETLQFQLIVQAPMQPGEYRLRIGGIDFSMTVSGRRARTGTFTNPFSGNAAREVRPQEPVKSSVPLGTVGAMRRKQRLSPKRLTSSPSSVSSDSSVSSVSSVSSPPLRIRLSIDPGSSVFFPDGGTANDGSVLPGTTYTLLLRQGRCALDHRGTIVQDDLLLRLRSRTDTPLALSTVDGDKRLYSGTLECRIVDGALALINELPLEQYLEGLAEEPDTEPYEKQRAFAIAARTYAAYYMKPENRKFPGKPYDGSDDPASFQAYHGVLFADRNPSWVKAVHSTKSHVLTYKGALIKPPYFSSDDGRTRSPAEAGWNNFPASEILFSKDDPWCKGLPQRGHGVGMSGCGALGQAKEGKSAEQILEYYYPGVTVGLLGR